MNGSRSTPQRLGDRSSLDALSRTIEGLEARIEGLVGQSARDVAPRAAEPTRETWSPRSPERDPRDVRPDPLAEIRERQRMLEERRNRALSSAARPPIPSPRDETLRQETERRLSDAYRPRDERPLRAPPAQPAYVAPAAPVHDAALKEIAQALVSLREELKRDINEGVSREMSSLKAEIRDIKSVAGDQRNGSDDLRSELARLGESIDLLGHQTRTRGGSQDLAAEFEDLRSLMDGLAREESVRHMETRWTGMERRIADLDPMPIRDEVVSLAYRLDDIKNQLGTLNPSPAIHALEDRLLAVAEAMEQLGRHIQPNDHLIAEQFAGLDLRLDEISRAIAAGARASQSQEPELFNRLERRLAGLAEQIDLISEDNNRRPDPALELARRIEGLSARVEELVNTDAGVESAARLEERLDTLSRLLERNHKQPPAPELTGFLSDISRKIDALDKAPVNDRLAERLDYLARRIDEIDYQPQAPAQDDPAMLRLEKRLSDIARRLDETAATPQQDTYALQGLESQIANLAALISQPSAPSSAASFSPEFESRMASIEDYMATSDEYIIEAARQAAEAVMEAYGRNSGPAAVDLSQLAALAGDLRHLEELANSSEERTHRTFEALHDTLVQIAGRLDEMDQRLGATTYPAAPVEGHYFGEEQPRVAHRAPEAYPSQAQIQAAAAQASLSAANQRGNASDHGGVLLQDDGFAFAGPVIRTVEPEVAAAVEETARAFVGNEPEVQAPKVKGSFLSGLTERLGRRGKQPKAQKIDPAASDRAVFDNAPSVVPDDEAVHGSETELLEPGSGAPDIKKILERVRANQTRVGIPSDADRSDLIAAARRAAQAAAQEARPSSGKAGKDTAGATASRKGAASDKSSIFNRHRRPILMAVGAVLLAIMTMPLVNTFLHGSEAPSVEASTDPVADLAVKPPVSAATSPAAAVPEAKAESKPAQVDAAAKPAPAAVAPVAPPAKAEVPLAPPAAAVEKPAPVSQAAPLAPARTVSLAEDPGRLTTSAPVAGAPAQSLSTQTPVAAATIGAPQAAAIAIPAGIEPVALADAAKTGDALALFEIGARFTEGRGVKSDLAEAARWYKLSADKGFAPAEYRIANLYEKGNGVERDLTKAREYYERAAKAGNASAMHNLAVLYATGIDGKPDTATAVNWFKQAADLGVADSQFNLAVLYARGNGIPQNLEESYKWFGVAAKGGDKDAAQKRDDVANAMRPDQLQNARANLDLWKVKPLDPRANATDVPDAWLGKGLKTASVDMKKAVRNIQAILNNNGFDAGKPDGEMGAKTVNAIKAFQKSAGMTADGKITDQLVKELLARNK